MIHPLLTEVEDWLKSEVRPIANQLDGDPALLAEVYKVMAAKGWIALKVYESQGGPGISEEVFREFQELIARYSGALAFLQTQHQSCANILMKSTNPDLEQNLVPLMVKGERLVGLGFSQLRRPGEPIMKAVETEGGYLITGHAPWITGWGIFDTWIVGATLPDGRAVFGLLPLEPREGMNFSDPMKLAAFESAQTVTADLGDVFLPHDQVVFVKRPGWIQTNDMINITLQGWFALGCARAALDVMEEAYRRRKSDFILEAAQALEKERLECREALKRADDPEDDRLRARAWVIDLAVRCSHGAIIASSGAANSLAHPAQRVYREALVYSVSAQTMPIMQASLRQLMARGGAAGT
jgi:alkylation response protein AidB-like acyl-CoA dehydrogenase